MNGIDGNSVSPRLWRVAVVSADATTRDGLLAPGLRQAGFDVEAFGDDTALYRRALARRFDILVLDIDLPDEDGLGIAAHMREADPRIGIVMVAGTGAHAEHLRALRGGADAYLAKPPDLDLLMACLRSLARRMDAAVGGPPLQDASGHPLSRNAPADWRLASDGWSMTTPTGQRLALTVPERTVLLLLDAHRGRPVTRERLIATLTHDAAGFDPHRLEALVHRIRRKAGAASPDAVPLPLLSVRGTGYVLGA